MIKIKRSTITNRIFPQRENKNPLKRSMSGYETEQFILHKDGSIDHSTEIFKHSKEIPIEKECAKSMVELSCFPAKRLKTTSMSMVENHIALQKIAKKEEKILFPFGTYFGKNIPEFREDPHYQIKQKIFGKEAFQYAGMCCGIHQHYALPRGVFDKETKNIKQLKNSKINKTVVDSFNFLTAIDPVITTLSQSSPFINGKRLGKSARIIAYRGGSFLDFKEGLYTKHRLFGALAQYKFTVQDLVSTQKRRYEKWLNLIKKSGHSLKGFKDERKMLAYNWSPVKINPHGTLEYRGYDANLMSITMGISTLVKFSLREIQQNYLIVMPIDMNVKDAFKVENNMVFIPPFALVTKLQKRAAYDGIDDDAVYTYVKNFYNFAKKLTSENYKPLLEPIEKMITKRETMSDKIIKYFKRKGYKDTLTEEVAKKAAIKFSKDYYKDLLEFKETLDKIEH